jgi:hypothetical protein
MSSTATPHHFTSRAMLVLWPTVLHSCASPRQIARAKAVKAEFVRQAEHASKEGRKAADILAEGAIVGVGLIQRDKSS